MNTHRRVFIATHGPWPHDCIFCGEAVDGHTDPFDATAACVHHIDEDRWNHVPENLVPCHAGCHSRHHNTGKVLTPETRAILSAFMKGKTHTPETRAKMSAAKKKPRKPFSAEHRAALSASKKGRTLTPEHRAKIGAAQKGVPKSQEHRARISAALRGRS